jgi:pyrroloquinoline-quinone synthase
MFMDKLRLGLSTKPLLKHKFYQLWSTGDLSKEVLIDYAKQYYCFINTFPRYISLVHSKCENEISRRILLDNLILEGYGRNNKAKSWRDFAANLGLIEYDIEHAVPNKTTEFVIDKCWSLCNESYASGLGMLYSHEFQAPKIALMQLDTLKKFYNMKNQDALAFFRGYKDDEWDPDKIATLIVKLFDDEQIIVFNSAIASSSAMWTFLDGIMIANKLDN